jgi:energy-coupling factor transporter ATP-binding protein EcfA2
MTPAMEVRDLRFRYADGTEALCGVSFTVAPGESVGIIGPNGAGKSTLLLHLNGLLPEQHAGHSSSRDGHGSVWIDGTPVAPPNLPDIRRRVGLLFQDANDQLFCPTVFEDVAFGPRQLGLPEAQVASRVADSLAKVGLTGFDHRPPHHLSGGEKRRACLAGVLACQPSILVLDEPTSSLDPKGRRELKELLSQIPLTKLIATHDLELVVELCSRVIVLDKGVIVAQGSTTKLLSNEQLMLDHGLERPHILRHAHPH